MTSLRIDNKTYRISWDMLAKNSLLLLFANSAASLAAVFFCIESRKLKTMELICVFNESISPLASTVMNRVKSPSIAACEICANPLTWVVKLPAMVLTANLSDASAAVVYGSSDEHT